MCKVFVIDTNKRPVNPIHSAQARQLLRNKKAAIYRRFPFTIILKEFRPYAPVADLRIKVDPGAKTTGIALVGSNAILLDNPKKVRSLISFLSNKPYLIHII